MQSVVATTAGAEHSLVETAVHENGSGDEPAPPGPELAKPTGCNWRHPVFRCLFHPILLALITCFGWGISLWMISAAETDVSALELAIAFLLGDAGGSLVGAVFGAVKNRVQGRPVTFVVDKRHWKTYVAAIVSPVLSIGGFLAYSLTIDFADGSSAIFAPLSGLSILPCVICGLVLEKKPPTFFMSIGFVLCLASVVVISVDLSEAHSDELANSTAGVLSNATTTLASYFTTAPNGMDNATMEDPNSDFNIAIVLFVVNFIVWGAAWLTISFVAADIPLFDRTAMWCIVETALALILLAGIYFENPAEYSGMPFASRLFVRMFFAHVVNKCGIVSYSEACGATGGKTVAMLAPIANMYPLVTSLLSILVNGETVTLSTGISIALALAGPIFLSVKQPPMCCDKKKLSQVVPNVDEENNDENESDKEKEQLESDTGEVQRESGKDETLARVEQDLEIDDMI